MFPVATASPDIAAAATADTKIALPEIRPHSPPATGTTTGRAEPRPMLPAPHREARAKFRMPSPLKGACADGVSQLPTALAPDACQSRRRVKVGTRAQNISRSRSSEPTARTAAQQPTRYLPGQCCDENFA